MKNGSGRICGIAAAAGGIGKSGLVDVHDGRETAIRDDGLRGTLTPLASCVFDDGAVQAVIEHVLDGAAIPLAAILPRNMVAVKSVGDHRSFSRAVKPGANTLDIKVTNLWVNPLIGDQQPNVTQKITYTAASPYRADSPLLPSGLIGGAEPLTSVQPGKPKGGYR